jgi:hypothetical protein
MILKWAPSHYPVRKIIALVATDAGMINFQSECGHVVWMYPYREDTFEEAFRVCDAWREGTERDLAVGCGGCFHGALPRPLGIPLPAKMAPEHYEALLKSKADYDRSQGRAPLEEL